LLINAYNEILDTEYFTEHDELLSPILALLKYFKDTWIRCIDDDDKKEVHLNLTFQFAIVIHWF